jgi:hypothetical protein
LIMISSKKISVRSRPMRFGSVGNILMSAIRLGKKNFLISDRNVNMKLESDKIYLGKMKQRYEKLQNE